MHYVFYPTADKRQDAIWRYTANTYGVEKATLYINGLHQHLQKLATKQSVWRALPENALLPEAMRKGIFFSQYKRHLIFFKVLCDDKIGILTILHDAMDLPARLLEDL